MNRFFCICCFVLWNSPTFSQTKNLYLCFDSLIPSFTRIFWNNRPVRVMAGDSCIALKARERGAFELIVEAEGYRTVVLKGLTDTLLNGERIQVKLQEKVTQLQEVTIKPENRIRLQGDTLIIAVDSIQTKPHSSSNELLEKIPGITNDFSGLKVFGKPVQQITVNGKLMYGGDVKAVLESIKSSMVKQLEVVSQGNATVLNIRLQDDKQNGTYGDAGGSMGTAQTSLVGARFNQIDPKRFVNGFINYNNINEKAIASKDENRISERLVTNGLNSAYSIIDGAEKRYFNVSARQIKNLPNIDEKEGINEALSGGLNYSKSTEKQEWFGYVLIDSREQRIARQQTTIRSLAFTNQRESSTSQVLNRGVKAWSALSGQFKPSDRDVIRFIQTTALSRINSRQQSTQHLTTTDTSNRWLSDSRFEHLSSERNVLFSLANHGLWVHRYAKPAKVTSLYVGSFFNRLSYEQAYQNQANSSAIRFGKNHNQIKENEYDHLLDIQLTHSIPLTRQWLLELKNVVNIENASTTRGALQFNDTANAFDIPRPDLGLGSFKTTNTHWIPQASIFFKKPKWSLIAGAGSLNWQAKRQRPDSSVIVSANWLQPRLYAEYRFSKGSKAYFRMGQAMSLPNYGQITPVLDSANIQQIVLGNDRLVSTRQLQTEWGLSTSFGNGHNVNLNLQYDHQASPIVNSILINPLTSLLSTSFVNYGYSNRVNGSLFWLKFNRSAAVAPFVLVYGSWQRNFILVNQQPVLQKNFYALLNGNLKWNYSTKTKLQLEWKSSVWGQVSKSQKSTFNQQSQVAITYETEWVKNWYLDLKTDLLIGQNFGRKTIVYPFVDLNLTKYVLPKQTLKLSLRVRNLLNQEQTFQIMANSNERTEQYVQTLSRFVMLNATFFFEKWRKNND